MDCPIRHCHPPPLSKPQLQRDNGHKEAETLAAQINAAIMSG